MPETIWKRVSVRSSCMAWPNSWKSVSTYGSAPHAAATLLMEMKDSAALRENGRSVAMTHYA